MRKLISALTKIPRDIPLAVAFSGGIDSTFVLHYLIEGNFNPTVYYFNHNTNHSINVLNSLDDLIPSNIIKHIGSISTEKDKKLSSQEFYRNERYSFLRSFSGIMLTGHQLNDVVETWIHSCISGSPKILQFNNNKVMRPFLHLRKDDMMEWLIKRNIKWVDDPSNQEDDYVRNKIRHNIIPEIKKFNNIDNMIYKKVIKKYSNIDMKKLFLALS